MTSFLAGFGMALSLIVAIGAQNAFVLRQAIRKNHIGLVVATCVISDAILIMAGVAGFGVLTETWPLFEPITRWGGAIFLIAYGALSMRRAFFEVESLHAADVPEQSAKAAVLTCLALTWLNPHVYLDTVVLLGAIAANYGPERWIFGAGGVFASLVFFVTLGYGATFLRPIFERPRAWQILEFLVGLLMWSIAFTLVAS